MGLNLWDKVEAIRQQPEPVRRRYVLLCLCVSMTFIVGIWFLSLKESFRSVQEDTSQVFERSQELIPSKGSTDRLNSLLERSTPLGGELKDEMTGQEYFEQQLKTKEKSTEEKMPGTSDN